MTDRIGTLRGRIRRRRRLAHGGLTLLLLAAAIAGPALVPERAEAVGAPQQEIRDFVSARGITQVGIASWYKLPGHKTADGERFRPTAMAAAHRWLPFGSIVRVTNLSNGRSVDVRINDRGPYHPGRIIDLTPRAAHALRMKHDGVTPVRIEVVELDLASAR